MSWTCPACQNNIRHSEVEATPRTGVTYRCSICRLELVFDPTDGKMTLAPLPAGDDSYAVRQAATQATPHKAADRRKR